MSRLLMTSWFAVMLIAGTARADETCRQRLVAKLEMTVLPDGRVTVPMTIGDRTVNMLVDTGAVYSMLTMPTVNALNLELRSLPPRAIFKGIGGTVVDYYVAANGIALSGLKRDRLEFLVLPGEHPAAMGGVLGPDIMGAYDMDFDFANATLNLFSQDHCEGQVIYWTREPYARIQFSLDGITHIRFPVFLDGKRISVWMDTGAFDSIGSLDEIEDKFDINEKSPDLKLETGLNNNSRTYTYPFKALEFGAVAINNPHISLVPDSESKMRHLFLIGMNVLRHLHIYVAYRERALYITSASAH